VPDSFAYYGVPGSSTDIYGGALTCTSTGFLYHVPSGLCVTARTNGTTYPIYDGSMSIYTLDICNTCGDNGITPGTPQKNQYFCSLAQPLSQPNLCLVLYGDLNAIDGYYGASQGTGSVAFPSVNNGVCIQPPA
jgi:hypothetical protein